MNATEMKQRAVSDQLNTALREIAEEHGYEVTMVNDEIIGELEVEMMPPPGEVAMLELVELAIERVGVNYHPKVMKKHEDTWDP